MNRKIMLITISCVIGLLTAVIYAGRIQKLRDEIADLTTKVPVVTTVRDLAPGDQLVLEDLTTVFYIKNQSSQRGITPEDVDLILGKSVFHPIPAGEPILWTDLPEGPRLRKPSEKIPSGFRAMSLPADEIHTMVHFIIPGDSVDIVSSRFSDKSGKIENRIVSENITVLGIGQRFEGRSQSEKEKTYPLSVTILATPMEALLILEAVQSGEVYFLARGSRMIPVAPGEDALLRLENNLSGNRS